MGYQIIRQPSGQFAVFSTYTDRIVVWDANAIEIGEYFAEQAAETARRNAADIAQKLDDGRAHEVYAQFTMTWDEALQLDREHGGMVLTEYDAVPPRKAKP